MTRLILKWARDVALGILSVGDCHSSMRAFCKVCDPCVCDPCVAYISVFERMLLDNDDAVPSEEVMNNLVAAACAASCPAHRSKVAHSRVLNVV